MTTPVGPASVDQELAAHLVASPVSAGAVGRVLASQLAFLLARNLPVIASCRVGKLVTRTGTATDLQLFWHPSPGCRLALLTVDLADSDAFNVVGGDRSYARRSTVTVTVPTGAGLAHMPVLARAGALDGTTGLDQQNLRSAGRQSYCSLIHLGDAGDVADQIHRITLTIDDVGGGLHAGFAYVSLTEIPPATLRPQDAEPGVLYPWIDARHALHDGDSGNGSGMPAFLTAEQDAATRVRWHFQIATHETTTQAWTRSSMTTGALTWPDSIGTTDPVFRIRVPAVYGTSASVPAEFAIRIRYNSTEDATFRVVRSVVGAGSSNHDEAIAASGGVWATHESNLTLRADGTDQEMDLSFHASTLDGSPIYISTIAFIQSETT